MKCEYKIKMQHLLILDYQTDAERKRIDYTIEKWSTRTGESVTKPKGVVVLYEGENLGAFVEDVYSRIETASGPPRIFSLEESSPDIRMRSRRLEFSTARSAGAVEDFVSYLLAKQSALFEYADGRRKVYSARTRKGRVRITVEIQEERNVRCLISVEGYGEVADFVAGRMEEEMKVFLGGV